MMGLELVEAASSAEEEEAIKTVTREEFKEAEQLVERIHRLIPGSQRVYLNPEEDIWPDIVIPNDILAEILTLAEWNGG